MTKTQSHVRGLLDSLHKRPLCTLNAIIVFLAMTWLGLNIMDASGKLTPQQLQLYKGPETFTDLHTWGIFFLIGGVCSLLRIVFLDFHKTQNLVHLPTLAVAVGWGIAFDFGVRNTGQPLYTFFAFYVFAQPFIPQIVFAALRFAGFTSTPKENSDNEIWNYTELRSKVDDLS